MKNPFEYPAPHGWPVSTVCACCVDGQLEIVRKATVEKLRDIIEWPGTGATIRKRAESRLRMLSRKNARVDRQPRAEG